MTGLTKGMAVALLHVLIVLSLGGKLLYDRSTRPRVWVRTAPVDPDLPIRGRYLTMSLQVQAEGIGSNGVVDVDLAVENGQLVARKSANATGLSIVNWSQWSGSDGSYVTLAPPVAFFLPEHAELPRLGSGDELWAEVTVPKAGPPRPIQLAYKHGDQRIPLNYR
jgi:hypothetical protein